MRAIEINRHFLSRADWVDPDNTVDRVIAGDPEREVSRCLVTWISSFSACREAVERGVDLLITHEPTFYEHWDRDVDEELEGVRLKRELLEDSRLVVMRNHDAWDRWPGVGIPWAWGEFLELGDPAATTEAGWMHRYDMAPRPFGEFVDHVATCTARLGEPVLQVLGDPAGEVSRIGIGTGCACSLAAQLKMGCDCSIVCDDGTSYWRDLQLAQDQGHPVIRVNHGTSEEPGMRTMADHINEHLDGVEAEYLPHRPAYRLSDGLR
jgi:putative NIF3 family GTP cyclohydrolase 1 type 2